MSHTTFEYSSLSLHEGILKRDPPCNGHTGYFLLRREKDQVILFHVGTLTAFECPLRTHYKLQNAAGEFVFDDHWKPRKFNATAMIDRIRWWIECYEANGLAYSDAEAASLLAALTGVAVDDLPPSPAKVKRLSTPEKAALLDAIERGEAPAPKARAARDPATPKGPGVIETIVATLTTDWKSVDEIADILAAAFPHKDREGMFKTVKTQIAGRITKERGIALEYDRKAGKVRRT